MSAAPAAGVVGKTGTRRDFLQSAAATITALSCNSRWLPSDTEKPVIFWVTDGLLPGDLCMALGDGLNVGPTYLWRAEDGPAGLPGDSHAFPLDEGVAVPVMQRSNEAIKFRIPTSLPAGLMGLQPKDGALTWLNRPQVWFIQPTELKPGLAENELYPGAFFQIVGKDFLLADDSGKTRVAWRAVGGPWSVLEGSATAERFSLQTQLPAIFKTGDYEFSVHNGFGGTRGWSKPCAVKVKTPEAWPQNLYDVRKLGALGDDVHDDTESIRKALGMAEKNGGGIIYFPYGTYRLSGSIAIPSRTVLRGAGRDISILKWPEDEPTSLADFTPAAIYTASQFALEDLTLIARKVDHTILDLSYEHTHRHTVPGEFLSALKPWSQYRDVFIRRVHFQHWLNVGHPERLTDPKLGNKIWSGNAPHNFLNGACVNFEVSDCIFQGGNNTFNGPQNGRVTGNFFSNEMNYSWTCLGGGARCLVVSHNEIHGSSSFGFGSMSLHHIYSAHNKSYNFVRGEREAMTLDVSSMPTKRAVAEYWGTPVAVTNDTGNVTLRFPAPSAGANLDGFRTGFTPNTFRGGEVVLHACTGGSGGGQTRHIVGNTSDTVTLDKPWDSVPDTTPRRMYLELKPRKNENPGITAAWVGKISRLGERTLTVDTAKWVPGEFIEQQVLVLNGRGAGQYRVITGNTETQLTIDGPWDVIPMVGAPIGVWAIVRHMTVYKCMAFDTSAFAQLYGSGYDYTVDSCHVERNGGIWGQMGWFVQFCRNEVAVGYSYHKGIGSPGPTPEHNQPYGVVGLNGGQLRLTKFGQVQYPEIPPGTAIFVDKLLGEPVPIGLGAVIRRNKLSYNERIMLGGSHNTSAFKRFHHAVIDGNAIEHTPVGIQIGADATDVLAANNIFTDVAQPYLAADKSDLKVI